MDEDGNEVVLDERESECLFLLTGGLEAATVSACPDCRCRVLAGVALVDLLDAAPPHPRGIELLDLADEAPTLHLYVVDGASDCDAPALAGSALRRMARRGRRARTAGPPLTPRLSTNVQSSSNASRTSRMNAATSTIAAGSMFRPTCTSSQYESIVTVSAQPVRGPIG